MDLKTKTLCLETTLRLCSRRKTNLQKLKLPKQSQKAKSQKCHLLLDLEGASQKAKSQKCHLLLDLEGASQKAKSQKCHLLLDLEGATVFLQILEILEILQIPEDCLHKPPLKRPNNKSPKLKLNQTPSLYNNQTH